MERIDQLRENLAKVQERIHAAERAAGRRQGSVQLMPVTKFHPVEDLRLLAELGYGEVGENREQEARGKQAEFPAATIHMIGQVQTKKANSVARWAGAVQSLDSIRLADALERGVALALERGDRPAEKTPLPVYLQVSADGDTARGGVTEADLDALAEHVMGLEHLELAGLMVVPPLGADAGEVFSRVRSRADRLGERVGRPMRLSAGMSGDLEEAIAAGSDLVRVGTAILGARPVG
ncbi:YggS family pyridoxal phosphate-dependent enzyme [Corynebacterium guangdongense]|uniref:Pyridoxal phosphate homeostasis protein n=1 Tax=Corynebacterium guangdongense TaxID=1783348 RepID=A0ABU2A0T1_9CORY|nr:YggS family pyridoxal phosphate-dependent enzyme [Corynebacterium guangdongense]MDR7329733.1 pyridoxal phosphate enzyme (YggS family) [Corynebacterium guangdongense]WJZ18297.1 hypothetical protein CGUA_08680 [Corynebacterium guangdongense]